MGKVVRSSVKIWLICGIVLILVQILLGAITRLTGSGLSITRWDIVTGVLFPLSDESWNHHFELYKQTPQYQKINSDMRLSDFKFIFFWEYFHRLWARMMGLVFVFPFVYFLIKNWLNRRLLVQLSLVIILAAFVASLGWIMVASGLSERPWVNAYKLSFHFLAAVALLTFIFFTYLDYSCGDLRKWDTGRRGSNVALRIFAVLVILQLFVAGVMSGTHAGLIAPTWPKIAKDWVPGFLLRGNFSVLYDWSDYDKNPSFLLLVQFVHRSLAYVIYGFAIWMYFYFRKSSLVLHRYFGLVVGLLTVQLILGILTVINCHGKVPLFLAISHQFMGLALWLCVFYGLWRIKNANISVL